MKPILYILLLFAVLFPTNAQVRDSSKICKTPVTMELGRHLELGRAIGIGVVFTAGAIGVDWGFYHDNINTPIKDFADNLRAKYGHWPIDDVLQYAPSAVYMGLGAMNMGNLRFTEHIAVATTAWLTMGVLVNSLKYIIADMRPDETTRNSFPSGHTATAFMGAELIRIEYGPWWGAGAYTLATGVALMRLYNGRHWANDLLGGATIGIFSAHIGYMMLPLERKWFRIKTREESGRETSLVILPFAGSNNTLGLSLAMEF
jgi:membrane-associated phospholipid phosphatase